jgi:hypothetical protein
MEGGVATSVAEAVVGWCFLLPALPPEPALQPSPHCRLQGNEPRVAQHVGVYVLILAHGDARVKGNTLKQGVVEHSLQILCPHPCIAAPVCAHLAPVKGDNLGSLQVIAELDQARLRHERDVCGVHDVQQTQQPRQRQVRVALDLLCLCLGRSGQLLGPEFYH